MQKVLLLVLCSIPMVLRGQSIERSVIGSAGATTNQLSWQLEWTLGEPAVKAHRSANGSLSEGFHQPLFSVLPTTASNRGDIRVRCFPVPTTGTLRVAVELNGAASAVDCLLFDQSGRIVRTLSRNRSDFIEDFDLSGLAAGVYRLVFRSEQSGLLYTESIVKHDK